MTHLAGHVEDRRREIDLLPGRGVEVRGEAAARLDAVELLEKIDVEVGSAEFTVGDAAQAVPFLERHDVADRRVLDGAELARGDLPGLGAVARGEERGWAQEAADVVGAERRG